MPKKILVFLVVFLILALSGGVFAQDFKIGVNNYLRGMYSVDILEDFARYTGEGLGMEVMAVNDEASHQKVISNVENMISSGVDGIVFFGISDNLFGVVANKCRQAQIPFVLYDHLPSDQTLERLRENPYFVGAVGTVDLHGGQAIGEYASQKGGERAIIVTGNRGDTTHEARTKGFTEVFEKNGGEVLDVGWGPTNRSDAMGMTENLLLANSDVDTVYVSNGDYGIGAMQTLNKYSDKNPDLYITDLDKDVLTALKNEKVVAANGAHWINSGFAVALLHNWLVDQPLLNKNGEAPEIEVPIIVLPNNLVNAYEKYWLEQWPYSINEMQKFSYKWNDDISLNDFREEMDAYSFESRLKTLYKNGEISEEEFSSFGF